MSTEHGLLYPWSSLVTELLNRFDYISETFKAFLLVNIGRNYIRVSRWKILEYFDWQCTWNLRNIKLCQHVCMKMDAKLYCHTLELLIRGDKVWLPRFFDTQNEKCSGDIKWNNIELTLPSVLLKWRFKTVKTKGGAIYSGYIQAVWFFGIQSNNSPRKTQIQHEFLCYVSRVNLLSFISRNFRIN